MVVSAPVPHAFRQLLKRLQKKHYPSVRAFADALETDASRLSRGLPFDVRGCLRLALLTGEPPSSVLRAAGKGDVAALIERLYGSSPPLLTADEQRMLRAMTHIRHASDRQALITIAEALAQWPSGGTVGGDDAGGGHEPGETKLPPKLMDEASLRRARSG